MAKPTENPSPSLVSTDAMHEVDESSQESSEGTSSGSRRKEEGNSEVDLISAIPLGEEEGHSRLQTKSDMHLFRSDHILTKRPASVIPKKMRAMKRCSKV